MVYISVDKCLPFNGKKKASYGVQLGVAQEMSYCTDEKLTEKRGSPGSQRLCFDSCKALLSVQNEKSRTELGAQMSKF